MNFDNVDFKKLKKFGIVMLVIFMLIGLVVSCSVNVANEIDEDIKTQEIERQKEEQKTKERNIEVNKLKEANGINIELAGKVYDGEMTMEQAKEEQVKLNEAEAKAKEEQAKKEEEAKAKMLEKQKEEAKEQEINNMVEGIKEMENVLYEGANYGINFVRGDIKKDVKTAFDQNGGMMVIRKYEIKLSSGEDLGTASIVIENNVITKAGITLNDAYYGDGSNALGIFTQMIGMYGNNLNFEVDGNYVSFFE